MSLLQRPEAKALLKDARVSATTVERCAVRLQTFLQRYLPLFDRKEQRGHATLIVRGKLSGLERKTTEPIANQARKHRKGLQSFVGAAPWDDEAVMAELRCHVLEELADPEAVLIMDGSAFPKKGSESCGVNRQWCGRLGKIENCQVGVYLAYAARGGQALVDRRLYLRAKWIADRFRREKCHVPPDVAFQEKWQIALEMVERAKNLPHAWVAGDDEFGRVVACRAGLRKRRERYVLDVPAATWIRDLEARAPRRRPRRNRKVPFLRADQWAARQPASRWRRFRVRDGEKGPVEVEAMTTRVRTKADGRISPTEERLLVIRTFEPKPEISYALSNADPAVPLGELVRVKYQRHRIEEVFERGKGEVGLAHYEVRSWVGWHHHMTLSLLALWFLELERRQIRKKKSTDHRGPSAANHDAPPSTPDALQRRHRSRDHARIAA
jgi:SRSO17 transposase